MQGGTGGKPESIIIRMIREVLLALMLALIKEWYSQNPRLIKTVKSCSPDPCPKCTVLRKSRETPSSLDPNLLAPNNSMQKSKEYISRSSGVYTRALAMVLVLLSSTHDCIDWCLITLGGPTPWEPAPAARSPRSLPSFRRIFRAGFSLNLFEVCFTFSGTQAAHSAHRAFWALG
jgi:hypothetical protein